jgi:hypothetical protein
LPNADEGLGADLNHRRQSVRRKGHDQLRRNSEITR